MPLAPPVIVIGVDVARRGPCARAGDDDEDVAVAAAGAEHRRRRRQHPRARRGLVDRHRLAGAIVSRPVRGGERFGVVVNATWPGPVPDPVVTAIQSARSPPSTGTRPRS